MIVKQSNRELWISFFTMLLIALLYLWVVVVFRVVPAASGLFGHSLGILGFILMLMTETLYSLRKRSTSARWGRMSSWLQFHIFTGLVGPFMVLLHTSWKFHGLAGVVLLFTVIVVGSGFVGRYIYTAVPRTADGIEVEANEITQEIQRIQSTIEDWLTDRPEVLRTLAKHLALQTTSSSGLFSFLVERPLLAWEIRLRWWLEKQRLSPPLRIQANQLESLLRRQQLLRSQFVSISLARRLLSIWHAVHIPIGLALFTAAFIHMGAAIYYATLLR